MKLSVDIVQRQAKMRAHTATHLLHYGLEKLLWSTKQAWSLVDNDLLRFDFSCKDPISAWDLQMLESTINSWIQHGLTVHTNEMTMNEAKDTWAKAFFEDKYGDTVRVVKICWSVDDDLDLESIELCWGTHVNNTADIWAFKIIEHSSVAAWIRRITAVTGTKVSEEAQKYESRLTTLAARLDCQPKQLEEKIEKILGDLEHLQADHASLQGKIICTHLDEFHQECELPSIGSARGKGCILNISWTDLEHHSFKEVVNAAKWRRTERNRILYTNEGNFAIYTWTWDLSAKDFAKQQGLKWGGSDQFVQGKDEKIKEVV